MVLLTTAATPRPWERIRKLTCGVHLPGRAACQGTDHLETNCNAWTYPLMSCSHSGSVLILDG